MLDRSLMIPVSASTCPFPLAIPAAHHALSILSLPLTSCIISSFFSFSLFIYSIFILSLLRSPHFLICLFLFHPFITVLYSSFTFFFTSSFSFYTLSFFFIFLRFLFLFLLLLLLLVLLLLLLRLPFLIVSSPFPFFSVRVQFEFIYCQAITERNTIKVLEKIIGVLHTKLKFLCFLRILFFVIHLS